MLVSHPSVRFKVHIDAFMFHSPFLNVFFYICLTLNTRSALLPLDIYFVHMEIRTINEVSTKLLYYYYYYLFNSFILLFLKRKKNCLFHFTYNSQFPLHPLLLFSQRTTSPQPPSTFQRG